MNKELVLKKVSKNIQKIRIEKGYTQETFAEKMGVSWSYVSKLESGILNLSLGKVVELAEYLDVDVSQLLVLWIFYKLPFDIR